MPESSVFSIEKWKAKTQEMIKDRFQNVSPEAKKSIYAALTTCALVPVIKAIPALSVTTIPTLLFGSLSNIGVNVASSALYDWLKSKRKKEQPDEQIELPDEEEIEQLLISSGNEKIKYELDSILQKLDVINTVRDSLHPEDQQHFLDNLQKEITEYGNLPESAAQLWQLRIFGNQNTVNYITHQYFKEQSNLDDATQAKQLQKQIDEYLSWLYADTETIELRGIKREGQQVVQLPLDEIYVPLQIKSFTETDKNSNIQSDKVLTQGRLLSITGGPGSGKTTILLYIAKILSQAIKERKPEIAQKFLSIDDQLPLPILISLSSFSSYLRDLKPADDPHKRSLAAYISHVLIENVVAFNLPSDFFLKILQTGKSILLLLDGLDEVPDESGRSVVREAIEKLVNGRENLRIIVTCRTVAYKGQTALGKGFREIRVLPLEEPHVENLISKAYQHLFKKDKNEQDKKRNELILGVRKLEEERKGRLGENADRLVNSPLLVRMLIIVHFSQRRIPDQRAEFYMRATDTMLLPEHAMSVDVANSIAAQVGGSKEKHLDLVQDLAFAMHQRGKQQGREIEENDLKNILKKEGYDDDIISSFIALTRLRGTVMEERQKSYRFLHLAFQEYLAARYLVEVVRSENQICHFFEQGPILDDWWREPALLTIGYLALNSPKVAQRLVQRFAGCDADAKTRNEKLEPGIQLAMAELAASALIEWGEQMPVHRNEIGRRIITLFEDINIANKTNSVFRARTGGVLARLGDPRDFILDVDAMQFCLVPGGPFMMGSDKKEDDQAYGDEEPLHENKILQKDYWLARFPVTVTQFRQFMQDSSYKLDDDNWLKDPLNRPVRYVNWHDAMAFCDWLHTRWQEKGWIPLDYRVMLPSEAEWEKAARGGLQRPQNPVMQSIAHIANWKNDTALQENELPKRIYPWGQEMDKNKLNFSYTGIGEPSTVGCFSNGVSPCGCEEMSGNILEWTRTKWRDSYDITEDNNLSGNESRVVRGGAFSHGRQYTRCAFRKYIDPSRRSDNIGFRVALALSLVSG